MDNPYPICENCIFVDEPLDKDPCQECNRAFLAQRIKPNFVSKRKPQTNADRIRAMTDEELYKFIVGIYSLMTDQYGEPDYRLVVDGNQFRDDESLIDWLKQEATE